MDKVRGRLIERAAALSSKVDKKFPPHLLLTEGHDARMVKAAELITDLGYARVTLLCPAPLAVAKFDAVDFKRSNLRGQFIEELIELRKAKGLTRVEAEQALNNELYFGAMYLKNFKVDAAVSGAANTTADVIRAGIHCLGTKPGIKTVSSSFLMILPNGRQLTYADCGVVPYPDARQLAEIAVSAAETHARLTGEQPVVAMLSFSTKGSAKHERVSLIQEALEHAKQLNPKLLIDGELQFDAAFVPEIASRKAPGSQVAGRANVFVFPNLDAGNIAYKITERIGGAIALGPLLQGLSNSWMDLSRGCSAEDIALVGAISLLLS